MDYENDIKIDETILDLEWLEQPTLFMRYANYAAQTAKEVELLRQKLDVLKADLDRQIRESPQNFGIEKVTETAITSIITTNSEYKELTKNYIQAKYENDIAKGAVQAFNQRKEALENLVKLHGQQYFAGPKVVEGIKERRLGRQKKVNASIAKKRV